MVFNQKHSFRPMPKITNCVDDSLRKSMFQLNFSNIIPFRMVKIRATKSMEVREKKRVKNLENNIASARLDAVKELRLPDRFTIELIILFKSGGYKGKKDIIFSHFSICCSY